MRQPEVHSVKLDEIDGNMTAMLELHISEDLDYFTGHFPSLPILPGVVQLDWAIKYARKHLPISGEFSALEKIKFQSLVLPNTKLTLMLAWISSKRYLEFNFTISQQKYSSGRVVFIGAS